MFDLVNLILLKELLELEEEIKFLAVELKVEKDLKEVEGIDELIILLNIILFLFIDCIMLKI